MQFKILGANAESGDDVDVMLEAPSQSVVEQLAHDRGILVASITPIGAAGKKDEMAAISLVDDPPAAAPSATDPAGNGHAAAPAERPHGIITTNANTPSDSAHSAAGHAPADKPDDQLAHYHIIMNQSLYLLESAVNKHLKDGWEVQGSLSVGMSNNALQFFQAMVKKPKVA